MKNKNLENLVDQEGLALSTEINLLNTSVIARTEALDIITYLLNAFLNVRQQSNVGNKWSEEELSNIQAAVNEINNNTQKMYDRMEELLQELQKSKDK